MVSLIILSLKTNQFFLMNLNVIVLNAWSIGQDNKWIASNE